MPGVLLWGWYKTNKVWLPVQVDVNGFVKVDMSAINLGDLADVTIAGLADGHFLSYSVGLGYWQNRLLAEGDIPAAIARDAEVANAITAHADLTTGVHAFDKSARVYHDADQSIPHNTETVLAFNSERWDTDAIHDPTINNSRLTCKTAGKYIIVGQVSFEFNIVGRRYEKILLNGATDIAVYEFTISADAGWPNLLVNTIYSLAVNDYVELVVWQNSGGALDAATIAQYSPEFMMARIA